MQPHSPNGYFDHAERQLRDIDEQLRQLPNKHYIELRTEERRAIAAVLEKCAAQHRQLAGRIAFFKQSRADPERVFLLEVLADAIGTKIFQAEHKHLPPIIEGRAVEIDSN